MMSRCRRVLASAMVAMITAATTQAQAPTRTPRHTDRTVALARLDAAVHYFHPAVATRATAWDSAFAAQAPRIVDAVSAADYAREIERLLAAIADPATRLVNTRSGSWTAEWLPDSALLLRRVSNARADARLAAQVRRARTVVVDVRDADLRDDAMLSPTGELTRALVSRRLAAPTQRALVYSGFPAATFQTSGGYGLSWRVVPAVSFEGTATSDQAIVFLADQRSVLPTLALAMQREGRARVASTGATYIAASTESHRVEMGEGVVAVVRLSESATIQGTLPPGDALDVRADTTLSESGTTALSTARWSASTAKAPRTAEATSIPAIGRPDASKLITAPVDAEWNAAYPARGYRMLAAARLWSTIQLFFPYKQHMSGAWDAAFRAALASIENAADELAYGKAMAAFATHINDSHVSVASGALYREVFGTAPAPVQTRFIEDILLVTRVLDSSAVRAGLMVGDEILTIDGETVAQRSARQSAFMVSSTPQALQSRLGASLLYGSNAQFPRALTVRGANGAIRNMSMTYPLLRQGVANYGRTGSIFRILSGNVGYADLERLPVSMVDSMFRTLAGTSAIIFDMRGYPQGTAWSIAPRLNTHSAPTVAARFRRLIVPSPDTTRTTDVTFEQPIPPLGNATPYRGRTVMLIDERAISQAEHTGLFFESANNTAFIGSPTQGANGDVTNTVLPGRISLTFSGHDVRHADGRQLQRVGLTPAVAVRPTIAGIRAGRDEVLESALKHLGAPGEVPADTYVEPLPKARRVVAREGAPEAWSAGGNRED